MLAGGVEQHLRADNVRPHERARVVDRAVDVAFGREVDHAIDAFGEEPAHQVAVGNVAAHEPVARAAGDIREIGEIAGVRQGVEVEHGVVRVGGQRMANEVAADEAAAAGDEQSPHQGSPLARSMGPATGKRSRRTRCRYLPYSLGP